MNMEPGAIRGLERVNRNIRSRLIIYRIIVTPINITSIILSSYFLYSNQVENHVIASLAPHATCILDIIFCIIMCQMNNRTIRLVLERAFDTNNKSTINLSSKNSQPRHGIAVQRKKIEGNSIGMKVLLNVLKYLSIVCMIQIFSYIAIILWAIFTFKSDQGFAWSGLEIWIRLVVQLAPTFVIVVYNSTHNRD